MNKPIIHIIRLITLVSILLYVTEAQIQAGEIHQAAAAGDLNKVKAILETDKSSLESTDENKSTALHIACMRNQVAVANYLIDKGANVNARNNWGQTPLHWANGIFGQDYTLIKRLIEKGANVNACGNRGESVLQWATMRKNYEIVKLLIDKGADLEAYDQNYGTVLHNVIRQNHMEMAKFLVKNGSKLNTKDPLGYTALHLATFGGDFELVELLIQYGADIHAPDFHDHTALFYAAKHGYKSVADLLIKKGADKTEIKETNFGKPPQLSGKIEEGEICLWYLGIDGYAIKTKSQLLLIDPPGINESIESGLANGHLNPTELSDQKITVLITKPDWERYELGVFELGKKISNVNYVISFNPEAKLTSMDTIPAYQLVIPGQNLTMGDVCIHSIQATLGGVAYLVEADGLRIYHAGYHVSNDSSQAEKYKKEIDLLKPMSPIDIAILPVSGHLITTGTYEPFLYLISQLSPQKIFLMHGFYEYAQYAKCTEILKTTNIPVQYPENRGDRFFYSK